MAFAGLILQVLAVVLGSIGIVVGFGNVTHGANGLIIIVGSVIGMVLTCGIGGALIALEDIKVDTRRSADANERTARAVEQFVAPKAPAVTDAAALIAEIEANPPLSKPRATVLGRVEPKKPDAGA